MELKNKIILALQKNNLSEIEKDILLEDLRILYSELKNSNTNISIKETNKTQSTTYNPPVFKEVEKTEPPINITPMDNINIDKKINIAEKIVKETEPEFPITKNEVKTNTNDLSTSIDINEKFKNHTNSDINKQFKQESTSLNKKPFKNIADLLDLNTRIFLSQTLFSNNMNLLLVFIEELDKNQNIATSMDFIHDELGQVNDESAIEKIRELVITKFNS